MATAKTKSAPKSTGAAKSKTETTKSKAAKSPAKKETGSKSLKTTNHDEIKAWVEKHGGTPATVKGTDKDGEHAGLLRIDFPGYSGKDSLEPISWEDFFKKFDESNLEFLYQESTSDGKESRFNKFVAKE